MSGRRDRGKMGSKRLRTGRGIAALAAALGALALCASSAVAAVDLDPERFVQMPENGVTGSGAGQLELPRGVASSPISGHLYVVELSNRRISEFTAWGEFVRAWGWGVKDGAAEAQVCTEETDCGKGSAGGGAGQFAQEGALGVAVDSTGAVYVYERENQRVQKFSAIGEFELMFGGEVNKTTGADVCSKADLQGGDECGAGVAGTGPGEFSSGSVGNFIADGPTGTIFVGDVGRIQEFDPDGTFKAQTPLVGETVQALAVDPTGALYVVRSGKDDVVKLGGSPCTIKAKSPRALASDPEGNLYVLAEKKAEAQIYDSTCSPLAGSGAGFGGAEDATTLNGIGVNDSCNADGGQQIYVSHFDNGELSGQPRSYVRGYGPQPDPEICAPPKKPPTIEAQYAVSAGSGGATVRAEINPHFWGDATYHVEYGTGKCTEGGCEGKALFPGVDLGGPENSPITTTGVFLAGLTANTTYHFRFVAQSGGGGPVFAVEGSFKTFPPVAPLKTNCPNQGFRSGGASARLPDCRAYELVSPLDKDNGDVLALLNVTGFPTELSQSAVDGESLAYSSYRAFGDPASAPYTNEYLARRDPLAGWSSEALSPPRGLSFYGGESLENPFKSFTADLGSGWLVHDAEPTLDSCAPKGFANLYRRSSATGAYEALICVEPPTLPPASFNFEVQGHSADGSHTIFRANDKLSEEATAGPNQLPGPNQLYEAIEGSGGKPRLVCILPDGEAVQGDCSAGTANSIPNFRFQSVENAISEDGQRIFWSASESGPGKLYVRIGGVETIPVSLGAAQFHTAAANGSAAIYTEGGELFEFDLETETGSSIAKAVLGVAGASEDVSRVYFVSEEDLGGEAQAGQPNLYLHERGVEPASFIATLSAIDVNKVAGAVNVPSPISKLPIRHTAQASADGGELAFMSTASLSGYDNTDANSGEADAEVFLYDAEAEALHCASCNPAGARPAGREVAIGTNELPGLWAAARIPAWESQVYVPRYLSDDGERLFFESFEALVPRDTNGKQDVYELASATDEKECLGNGSEIGGELFVAGAGGCLSLISSGQSSGDSEFLDASPSGDDAFIATESSLVPPDYGLIDVYDARVGGGFDYPDPPPRCEGEACQPFSAPPDAPIPSSATSRPGNPRAESKPKPRGCPKGKRMARRKGKVRCLKVQQRHQPKHRHQRRAER